MPSNDDLLFAEHAVRGGFLTREEVDETLAVQRRMEEMGVRDSLRNVLVNRGVLREGDAAIVARQAGLQPGREPIPGYALESRLGVGAMGSVYKAWQRGMQRHVAVKILRRDLTSDPRQVERLRREAALVGKLDHPNIVHGLDSGESEGLVWFSMEYVEGETLRERIRRTGRIPPDEAVRITRQIAEALLHAHTHGIVHRDIKPGNVLLDKEGLPRLTDYGLAKGQSDDALTQIDATLGTPQYVSPEQARNPRDADIRSDIYSLGASLYTMLTGGPPFEGETLAQTLTKVLYERPRPLREAAPGVPEPVVYVVERMMAKDRRHRYADPTELLTDLRQLEEGRLVVPSGFEGDIGAFVEKRRQRRIWLAGAGIVAAAVLASVASVAWEARQGETRRQTAAASALETAHGAAGPRERWTSATVEDAIKRLEKIRSDYPGTAAADTAGAELAAWRAQADAIGKANELARRANPDDANPDWPRVVTDMEELVRRLAADPDATVARARLDKDLADVRERRDHRAKTEFAALADEGNAATLREAALAWESKARHVSERFYGGAPAAEVTRAQEVGARFTRAAERLETRWAAWTALGLSRGALPDELDLARAESLLESAARAAREDRELQEILAALPPAGRWTEAGEKQERAARDVFAGAALRAWAAVERDAQRLASARSFNDALAKLDAFLRRAPSSHRHAAEDLRERIDADSRRTGDEMLAATEAAGRSLLAAYLHFDTEGARKIIADLEARAASRPRADGGAAALAEGARRLLELTDQLLWARVRSGIAAYAASGGALFDTRRRSGFAQITSVAVGGEFDLRFHWGANQTWTGSLKDIALDDLLRIAKLSSSVPEEALVLAALRLTRYDIPQDPREGSGQLTDITTLLRTAERVPGATAIVEHLLKSKDRWLVETGREITDAEDTAESEYRRAREALEGGRPADAARKLRELLATKRLRLTNYVSRRATEMKQMIEQAERASESAGFATQFPGAAWTEETDGTATLFWDFEDAAAADARGARLLGLVEGRTGIRSRFLPESDVLGSDDGGVAAVPVVVDHCLAWEPKDAEGTPRDTPVRIPCPFQPRKRIEVSFLVSSERPFFFAVSVCGAAAGVLSSSESKFNGRGITIWGAADLDKPDLAFDERTRTTYLEAHPDQLRREESTRFFQFEAGRLYRVRVVRDDRRVQLLVDGRLRLDGDVKLVTGPLADQVVLLSWGPSQVDDLRITGTPDPDWVKKQR